MTAVAVRLKILEVVTFAPLPCPAWPEPLKDHVVRSANRHTVSAHVSTGNLPASPSRVNEGVSGRARVTEKRETITASNLIICSRLFHLHSELAMIVIPTGTDAPIYHWPYATVGLIVLNVLLL